MIAVLDYGIGNLASAQKALASLGADARLVTDAATARNACGVVLPGVGSFGRCMEALQTSGLDIAVADAFHRGIPFLGICVGFQMLYQHSEESPGVAGLGILAGSVAALPAGQKRPQMQWNALDRLQGTSSSMLEGLEKRPWFYFVHSYAPVPTDRGSREASPGGVVATCDYGGPVIAAIELGNVWAVQFHPEKSGKAGLRLLENFIRLTRETTGP